MADAVIRATDRPDFGKGAARRTRRAGLVPAVIYGHNTAPVHVALPVLETARVVRRANALVSVVVEDREYLTLIKDVQRHVVGGHLEHLDLLVVKSGDKVTVEIPVILEGESAAGTTVNQEVTVVTVEAEATHVPTQVVANIEGRSTHLFASDLQLPKGARLLDDEETLIVHVAEVMAAGEEGAE